MHFSTLANIKNSGGFEKRPHASLRFLIFFINPILSIAYLPSANTSLPFEDRIDIFDDDHRKNFVIPAPYQVRDKLQRESRLKTLDSGSIPE
jgi:hypothetical protein